MVQQITKLFLIFLVIKDGVTPSCVESDLLSNVAEQNA